MQSNGHGTASVFATPTHKSIGCWMCRAAQKETLNTHNLDGRNFFLFLKLPPKNHRWHSRKGAVNWSGRINDIQIAGSTRHDVPSWGRHASRAEVYRLGLLNRYVNTNTDSGHVNCFWKIVAIIFHFNSYAFLYITSKLILTFFSAERLEAHGNYKTPTNDKLLRL